MKFDMHLHTNRHSPDSSMDPGVMLRRAGELGLDGLVITEHDWLWTEAELEELRTQAPRLVILSGIEVWRGRAISWFMELPTRSRCRAAFTWPTCAGRSIARVGWSSVLTPSALGSALMTFSSATSRSSTAWK